MRREWLTDVDPSSASEELGLREAFQAVEKYALPLVSETAEQNFSKEENRILALQNVNRLNQRIGFLVREKRADAVEMKLLQTYVNSLTVGLKTNNKLQIKSALFSVHNFLKTIPS